MSAPLAAPPNLARLRHFVRALAVVVDTTTDEDALLAAGGELLGGLVAHDDWLPDVWAAHDPARYQQHLLHCDSRERFSVVSFVWGPGQATPVHDHRVWGLVGVLRGAELNEGFTLRDGALVATGPPERLAAGRVTALSPRRGDIHRVANAHADRVSISIHVYGANIGAVERATYDAAGGTKRFVSGYASASLPNIWGAPA